MINGTDCCCLARAWRKLPIHQWLECPSSAHARKGVDNRYSRRLISTPGASLCCNTLLGQRTVVGGHRPLSTGRCTRLCYCRVFGLIICAKQAAPQRRGGGPAHRGCQSSRAKLRGANSEWAPPTSKTYERRLKNESREKTVEEWGSRSECRLEAKLEGTHRVYILTDMDWPSERRD